MRAMGLILGDAMGFIYIWHLVDSYTEVYKVRRSVDPYEGEDIEGLALMYIRPAVRTEECERELLAYMRSADAKRKGIVERRDLDADCFEAPLNKILEAVESVVMKYPATTQGLK